MILSKLRSGVILITTGFIILMIAKTCSKKMEEADQAIAAYQATCQGSPLSTVELRDKAMEDGYEINRRYDCIDKASFLAVNEQKAKWEAANTPEAIAKREAEFKEKQARYAEERARQAAVEQSKSTEALPNIVLRDVDVNNATETELANVITIGSETAKQIIEERNKRRFNDWADLINRVIPLSAAQTAVYASICGLNVNGQSLTGVPPNAIMAAQLYKKYQQYRKN